MNRTYLWSGVLLLLLCSVLGYYYMTLTNMPQLNVVNQGAMGHADLDEMVAPVITEISVDHAVEVVPAPSTDSTNVTLSEHPARLEPTPVAVVAKKVDQSPLSDSDKPKIATVMVEKVKPPVQQQAVNPPLQIERVVVEDPIQLVLQAAYASYQEGNLGHASDLYRQALDSDAENRDALLGLAVIAQRQGQQELARTFYQRLLVLNPKDSVAVGGLLSMNKGNVTTQNISQLKLMLQEEPTAAHLYFSVASEYALQSRWPEAQQAYFQAFHYAPENADYAFNLAVSLEKMGQSQSAITYYRRALAAADNGGVASFDRWRVTQRLVTLTAVMSEKQGG